MYVNKLTIYTVLLLLQGCASFRSGELTETKGTVKAAQEDINFSVKFTGSSFEHINKNSDLDKDDRFHLQDCLKTKAEDLKANTICSIFLELKPRFRTVAYSNKVKNSATHYEITIHHNRPSNTFHSYLGLFTLYIIPYWSKTTLEVKIKRISMSQREDVYTESMSSVISIFLLPFFPFFNDNIKIISSVARDAIKSNLNQI